MSSNIHGLGIDGGSVDKRYMVGQLLGDMTRDILAAQENFDYDDSFRIGLRMTESPYHAASPWDTFSSNPCTGNVLYS